MTRRDDRSPEAIEYRRRYKTARWRHARAKQLGDYPLCSMCMKAGRVTPATVCDHVDPKSKLTEEGFFAGPFNSLCKPHHDGAKQAEEKRGFEIGCDANGWPLDAGHHWNMA